MNYYRLIVFVFFVYACPAWSQNTQPVFQVIPLGVKGGIDEGNLSAYMLAAEGTNDYICLDAGTIHDGIQKSVDAGLFKVNTAEVLREYIKAYLISHAHLDHVAGLIINAPEDSVKPIYGLPFCLDILKNNYFTWKSWANFANEGDKPFLNKYHYETLMPGKEVTIANTTMGVTAYALSHSNPYQSTAFLISHGGYYFLYLGDTGADEIENAGNLLELWKVVAPLIKDGRLKAIFIEVSFPNEQSNKQLFGHLTPKLLMHEMHRLAELTGEPSLKGLPVAITHIKPNGNNEEKIKKQLDETNTLGLKLVFPRQAVALHF
jgi:cAMP phosphodiesterase